MIAELEFGVGEDDAARRRVIDRLRVDFEREIAQMLGRSLPTMDATARTKCSRRAPSVPSWPA